MYMRDLTLKGKFLITTSRGTKYTHEIKFDSMPPNPLERPMRVASDIFRASVYFSIISLDTSSEVKASTLPGNAPTAEVP